MEFFKQVESGIVALASWIWGAPLLILLLGGGLYFVIYTRFSPYKYFRHAINVLLGKYDDPDEIGEINHYEALSTHLAATVGMGNISGVAIAIVTGGPGAIFWMWISALVGVATKFFTCSLAIMYRGKDSAGAVQGGPMYVITEGLGKKWKPLAILFCITGMIGVLPIFQANQLTQAFRDVILIPNGIQVGF
ncbi:MAG: alanine:cation symporter family protein, partial [Bacteroidetes bacterium]|nr:alanine:cation symporter family protein [Bacteroidota bacterium]